MKTKLLLFSLVAFLLFGTNASADPDPNFYIYLCFGQSNMESGGNDNLIKDLGPNPEDVPVLAGETVNEDQEGKCAAFNKIMAELPKTLPNSYVISSAGCSCHPDHLHFNSEGSREFENDARRRCFHCRVTNSTHQNDNAD